MADPAADARSPAPPNEPRPTIFGRGQPAVAGVAAAVVAVATWRRSLTETLVLTAACLLLVRRWRVAAAVGLLGMAAVVRSDGAHAAVTPRQLGPYEGWATVIDDPSWSATTRIILQIDGERFELWARGRAASMRVDLWDHGDVVWVSGTRRALRDDRARRVIWQHVVGQFDPEYLGDRLPGRRLDVTSGRVRGLITTATSELPDAEAALARGLIIGEDDDQPAEMVARFRASGLSHLTAVSGQNVAFVLAVAGPVLRRAPPMTRLLLTLLLIGWFVLLTRGEPSVLRAGVMAGLGAVAFAFGREREPPRLLAVSAIGLLLVDPLLVYSVGFWLSVGATAGVTIVGPPLHRRLAILGPLTGTVAMTLAAQVGVVVPILLVFGRLPLMSVPANVLAVPVGSLVMLYGLPASLAAGAIPGLRGVLMLPVHLGVRWVDRVADVAAKVEPEQPWNAIGWVAVAIAVLWLCVRSGPAERAEDR